MPPLLRCLSVLLGLALAMPAAGADRRIAITIDDLPWQRIGQTPAAELQARHERLVAGLARAGVPVVGFVNEGKLEVDGQVDPARVAMLRDWLEAGHELGNHTHGHVDLHAVGLDAFQQDVLRGERVLRPLLAGYRTSPRWFRHPYLRAGRSAPERAALSAFLDRHGYRIAPVTVDNSEWIWALAYATVLDGQPATAQRDATLERIRRGYVPYMLNKVDYFEQQSRDLLGYALPQVWLLHANELNADTFAGLVAGAERRGYRLVSLEEALRDPAYGRGEAGYDGPRGPSWLHRWALGEGRPAAFFAGEPVVPAWVLELAGIEEE